MVFLDNLLNNLLQNMFKKLKQVLTKNNLQKN